MTLLKPVNFALAIGGAAGIATAVINPAYLGQSFAFLGGIVGGASLAQNKSRDEMIRKVESQRVTSSFSALYEKNRGLIDPIELAFVANCTVNQANDFLTLLAEDTGGQKIPTKTGTGVVFNFSHTSNALDTLSKNASEWAQAQTTQIQNELAQHKQAIQLLRAQQAAATLNKQTPAPTPAPEVQPDLWKNNPGL